MSGVNEMNIEANIKGLIVRVPSYDHKNRFIGLEYPMYSRAEVKCYLI